MKLGFALSGGGARGVGHLGMLKALDEAGIKPNIISGTSAGSIVATLYSDGYDPEEILEFVVSTKVFTALRPSLSFKGFLKVDTLGDIMRKHLSENDFEALSIPTIVVATDIVKGESVYFRKGEIIRPVMASCCVPVFFTPVNIDGRILVDGGVLDNLPASILKKEDKCDFVIGFHTNPISGDFEVGSIKSVIERSLIMAVNGNTTKSKEMCDYILEPPELGGYGGFDLGKSREMFEIGRDYVNQELDQLKKAIESNE